MRKKTRGSSLITVVIIFAILITVGTALLSMTVGDYKMRIKESRKIENLYLADSGLDVAYDIVVKTFDEAVKFGDFKARQLNVKDNREGPNAKHYKEEEDNLANTLNAIDNKHKDHKGKCNCSKERKKAQEDFDKEIEMLKKAEFERCFKVFIKKDSDEVDSDEGIPDNILGESICNNYYSDMRLEEKDVEKELVSDFSKINTVEFNDEKSIPKLFVCEEGKIEELKKITEEDSTLTDIKNDFDGIRYYSDNNNKEFQVKVTSRFVDKGKNNNDIAKNNLRVLQATYIITVPKYDDVTFKESKIIINPDSVKHNQIIVGGNMEVHDDSKVNLNIDGDIFVQGNREYITSRVYDKYKGGININNSDVNFYGDVYTASTFFIQDNSNVKIDKSLYALNVYAGKIEKGKYSNEMGGSSSLDISNGSVVVDNDLAIKAYNTDMKIKDFYGLNDKNINGNEKEGKLERTSSSIIVNGNKKSNIQITDNAYIMGVAHIEGENTEYTTGESTAVKGNYIAYANESNELYDVSKYRMGNLNDKEKFFNDYWEDKLEMINTGGIELPDNIHTVGAIVYRDKNNNPHVKKGTYTIDVDNNVKSKRLEYAKKVYNLNRQEPKGETDYFKKLYDNNGNNENPVDTIMKLYNIPTTYKLNEEKSKNNKAIFNNDDSKIIVIKGKGAKSNEASSYKIDAKDGKLNVFIATSGDVIIDGEVELEGNIITEGNLIVKGNGKKIIKYNQSVIDKIYEENIELFNAVFSYKDNDGMEKTFLNVEYDINKFLSNKLWKIIR
ncbi:hypothetical protein [uncultured Clostridium sp.]|uniref:hypothetical protein n=1 Tax=uncultured Clostridium sp. TaxID=59620 RepID=UPI0028EEBC62|nr:hypothetical protein [uncultured Clostridium sp.]